MIEGSVSDDGVPVIELEVANRLFRAIVDTGFNGDLELPEGLRARVNAQFVGRVPVLLAANRRIEEDVFLVDFPFDSRLTRAQATFVEGDGILIGTGLLVEHRLIVDFKTRVVQLERT